MAPSRAHIRSTLAAVVDPPDELRALRIVHKALADVNRLRIVQRLALGEATVTELILQVGLSQPLVSWHLGRLRFAGLVETRRAGRETVSRLIPEAFERFATYERRILGLGLGSPAAAPAGPASSPADPTAAGRLEEAAS
ncbi:MAG TPA: metalloregulator ArsR/SmtB family transcription factor [Candidatus Limnocylindrales bacterium]|nr:metalloregulator ArsR/SmtB family transcription factor [Candidatus Limnocylindrales bacterium]